MRWLQRYSQRRGLVAFALLALPLAVAFAQEAAPPAPKAGKQKTVAFEMRDMPWDQVLVWLADNTGLNVTSPNKPQGTFNHIRSSQQKRDYTIPEVIDILNDALLAQKFIIIRRPTSIIVLPSDEPESIDVTLLPRLSPEELDEDKPVSEQRYGRTELAQVIFPLRTLSYEDAERDLKGQFGKFGRIARVAKGNKILVTETVANLRRVKKLLEELEGGTGSSGDFEIINLGPAQDPQSTLRLLQNYYNWIPGAAKPANAPYLELDLNNNRLIVRGDAAQVQEVRNLVRKLGGLGASGDGSPGSTSARTISLEGLKTTPSTIIENLSFLWSDLRANPIVVLTQSQLLQKLEQGKKAPATPPAEVKPSDQVKPDGQTGKDGVRFKLAAYQGSTPPQLADPRNERDGRQLPGRADQPIYIAPLSRGNGLMIASDDAESLALVEELIRYLTQATEGEYAIIAIKHAQAKDVAATIDELYNGKRQQNPMMGMMMGPFGGGRGGGDSVLPSSGPSVRVVADSRTNSILVKAPKMELATIRRLVANDLDRPGADANALNKRYLIGPLANASASDVVTIIKEIYKDYMKSSSPQQGPPSPFPFPFGRGGQQEQSPSSSFTITVAADDRTNMIILNAPEEIFLQIDGLVKELDKTTGENARSVVVRRIDSVDPTVVAQALEAITGQKSSIAPATSQASSGAADPRQEFLNRLRERMGGGQGGMQGSFPGGMNRGQGGGRGGNNPGGMNRGQGGGNRGGGNRGGGGIRPEDGVSSGPPDGAVKVAAVVMDDPSAAATSKASSILYDPQRDPSPSLQLASAQQPSSSPATPAAQPANPNANPQPANPAGTQPANPAQPGDAPPRAARQPVSWVVLPDGQIILIGSEGDIKEVEEALNSIVNVSKTTDTEIRIFPMAKADATSVASILTRIYQQLILSPAGTVRQQPGQQLQTASLLILALPRTNSILVGGPKNRMSDIEENIKKLDTPYAADGKFRTFQLQRAGADRVAALLNQLYASRFPGEAPGQQNQIVITPDPKTNTVLVQAAPADLEEIERLIDYLEKAVSTAINELRIIPVKNAAASDLVNILQQTINEGIGTVTPATGTGTGAQQPFGQQFGQQAFGPQAQLAQGTTGAAATGRGFNLRFSSQLLGNRTFESGLLDEVFITADSRTNSLIVVAPPSSLDLVTAIATELDVPPTATAEVKVFQLKRADAQQVFQIIQQLYFGGGTTGQFGNQANPFGGPIGGNLTGNQFGQQQQRPTGFQTADGPSLITLRLALDLRTNSLIVAGSQGDVILIDALVTKLDSADVRPRQEMVYRVRNHNAQDLANSLQNFLNNEVQVLTGAGDLPVYAQLERSVVLVPDQLSNSLLISATPQYYPEVMRLIDQLDADPPQVVIQVLIAEIQLDNLDEFGVEWGVQTPVLFQRSLFSPPGTIVNNAIGNPGFNWNSTGPLGNSTNASPSAIGSQGITNFGVGRLSPSAGVGGFVFSAGSDAVNVLIRALKLQGKVEVLSRPQVSVMDNNSATIQSGQQVPIINGFTVNQLNQPIPTVEQQDIGIILTVQPRVTRDGYVIMRVEPTVSSLSDSTVDLGNGVRSPIINQTLASTTISAMDGQTVVIGGLITRSDNRQERKIPFLGDLPYLGAAFRFRALELQRRELLILLTPRVVRSPADMERIKAEEAGKMNWALDEVQKIHGDIQVDESLVRPPCPPEGLNLPPGSLGTPGIPTLPEQPVAAPGGEALPMPRQLPPATNPTPPASSNPTAPAIQPPPNVPPRPKAMNTPQETQQANFTQPLPQIPKTGYQPPPGYPGGGR